MHITILATGKCKDKNINNLNDEFIKRLKPHLPTQVIEIPQVNRGTVADIKKGEATLQLAKTPKDSVIIALDERGKLMPTMEFAKTIGKLRDTGTNHITFIIGGAEGLDESIREKSNKIISLSPMTFPHMMVRPILLEQIYRAATILAGHPYHREG